MPRRGVVNRWFDVRQSLQVMLNSRRWETTAALSGMETRDVARLGYLMRIKNGVARRNVMSLDERIVLDPDILVGKPVIKGTRLAVEFIIDLLAQGWTEADILRNYPGITREDILACLRYASDVLHSEKVYPLKA